MKTRLNYNISFQRIFAFLTLLFLLTGTLIAQEQEVKKIEGADAVREEIQRYMGYEPLLPRYLTLPYDATTNSNVESPHVDIGYLFMALIPILFLFGFKTKPWLGLLCMVLLAVLLYISVGSGKIVFNNGYMHTDTYITKSGDVKISYFPSKIISPIYKSIGQSYRWINSFFKRVSGDADSFTYPLLFLLFGFMIYLVRQRTLKHSNAKRILILFISFFTFMWMLLTAGIIWYGYPMIALSILLILSSISSKKDEAVELFDARAKKIIGLSSIMIFIGLSMIYRLSNYQFMQNHEMGKLLLDIGELKYQSGRQNKQKVLEGFFPGGFTDAIEKINSEDESLIYRVGTVLPFFVRKNDKRVFSDDQLQNFEKLRTHFNDKNTLIEVLKSGGYKYIFVDLLTYTVDKTPERTLENKYKEFMRVLYQNPKVKLLATNRRINNSQDPQKPKPEFGVFGTPISGFYGNYAIFELL